MFPGKRSGAAAEARHRLASLPPVILWAWERPERLDFINTENTGVAFLAKSIYLRAEKVVTRPRLQPLSVPPGTVLIAVARIESERHGLASLTPGQIETVSQEISEMARQSGVAGIQIDFDARVSERTFYSDLLASVRKSLPPDTPLTITALASWCKGDNWLDALPVDEAVPMLFRMGIDRTQILNGLASGDGFSAPLCGQSAGLSVDEVLPYSPASERLYVFNPDSWTPESVNMVMEKYHR